MTLPPFVSMILIMVGLIIDQFFVGDLLVSAFTHTDTWHHANSHTLATAPSRPPLRRFSLYDNKEILSESVVQTRRATKEEDRKAWRDHSVSYYSKVMREERRRKLGQIKEETYSPDHFVLMAKKHYFALRKIKDGKPAHAERIYRRIIDELLVQEQQDKCDHAKLAVTTLLLALLLQREDHPATQTRSVFLHFFRLVVDSNEECACSAKVLQAYALFEMKQGNSLKSLYLVGKAVEMDPTLRPVLQWKQFREAQSQFEAMHKRVQRH